MYNNLNLQKREKMKKLILSVIASTLFASVLSAEWVKGSVSAIQQYQGETLISITKSDSTTSRCFIEQTLSQDAKKAILAVALTAQSAGKDVWMLWNGNWDSIILCADTNNNCPAP